MAHPMLIGIALCKSAGWIMPTVWITRFGRGAIPGAASFIGVYVKGKGKLAGKNSCARADHPLKKIIYSLLKGRLGAPLTQVAFRFKAW